MTIRKQHVEKEKKKDDSWLCVMSGDNGRSSKSEQWAMNEKLTPVNCCSVSSNWLASPGASHFVLTWTGHLWTRTAWSESWRGSLNNNHEQHAEKGGHTRWFLIMSDAWTQLVILEEWTMSHECKNATHEPLFVVTEATWVTRCISFILAWTRHLWMRTLVECKSNFIRDGVRSHLCIPLVGVAQKSGLSISLFWHLHLKLGSKGATMILVVVINFQLIGCEHSLPCWKTCVRQKLSSGGVGVSSDATEFAIWF